MSTNERILTHLHTEYTRPVRDPLWKHIYLSDGLLSLLDTVEFQQLHHIKQLGPSYLLYPGATHTRFNHSIGVFHIARLMITALVAKPDCPPLSLEGVKAFLAASLLHDLGHFPYAHSLKELPLKPHERLAAEQIVSGPFAKRISAALGSDPHMVAAIIDETGEGRSERETAFYRSILSGTLDPDKLDYLNRDAYFCGVPYGIQDVDFAVSHIVPTADYRLALDTDGISAVENILFSKYLMYRAVYWHRTVRVATAMIKKALYLGLARGAIETPELYGLDDELFFSRFTAARAREFSLIEDVAARRLYKTVLEMPFQAGDTHLASLTGLPARTSVETQLAEEFSLRTGHAVSASEVIIDVPEAVSFELSMPIYHAGSVIDYPDTETVFTPEVIADFTDTLRRIRVMVPGDVAKRLHQTDIREIFESIR
ncbi:MAG: HD domain-containing protein [Spirochaetia bacterium]